MKKITEKTAKARLGQYWNDIKGIMKLSGEVNRDNPIYEATSPLITNFLLWRMLQELKIMNDTQSEVK